MTTTEQDRRAAAEYRALYARWFSGEDMDWEPDSALTALLATHRLTAQAGLAGALEGIAAHCDKLRNGTDDWFELVEFSTLAQAALTQAKDG